MLLWWHTSFTVTSAKWRFAIFRKEYRNNSTATKQLKVIEGNSRKRIIFFCLDWENWRNHGLHLNLTIELKVQLVTWWPSFQMLLAWNLTGIPVPLYLYLILFILIFPGSVLDKSHRKTWFWDTNDIFLFPVFPGSR